MTVRYHFLLSRDPGYISLKINCFNSTDQEAPYFQTDNILSLSGSSPFRYVNIQEILIAHIVLHSGPQARGNFTNPQHDDPDEIAFWKKEKETGSFLQSIASACICTNGVNLTYIGTAL